MSSTVCAVHERVVMSSMADIWHNKFLRT